MSLLLHPMPFVGFSRAQMLSENGLCRAFDAGADGYVRSEGAVTLVLRSESAARSNGDPIMARFVGSGTNADGRTAGLSLPSMYAQAALLRKRYTTASRSTRSASPSSRRTAPAPASAIRSRPRRSAAIIATRRDEPLLIGSSKTNFGHLEPASGLVGVLKSQMALANDCLPATLHFEKPNPDIRFAGAEPQGRVRGDAACPHRHAAARSASTRSASAAPTRTW